MESKLMEVIQQIKKIALENAGVVRYYTEDFFAVDYAGTNVDDAWEGGMRDGNAELSDEILQVIADFERENDYATKR